MRSKRHVAVLKQDELLLPDHDTAAALMGTLLVEGWEDHYTVYYGVLPGFDLDDVEQAVDQRPASISAE
ncbi:MAG: hypothetical protein HY275_12675 [Gemmatimonadetes bacterium]|nr:hypothetical protein [Gemmatimonadota bacterium]